jgi:hypothetical protein
MLTHPLQVEALLGWPASWRVVTGGPRAWPWPWRTFEPPTSGRPSKQARPTSDQSTAVKPRLCTPTLQYPYLSYAYNFALSFTPLPTLQPTAHLEPLLGPPYSAPRAFAPYPLHSPPQTHQALGPPPSHTPSLSPSNHVYAALLLSISSAVMSAAGPLLPPGPPRANAMNGYSHGPSGSGPDVHRGGDGAGHNRGSGGHCPPIAEISASASEKVEELRHYPVSRRERMA